MFRGVKENSAQDKHLDHRWMGGGKISASPCPRYGQSPSGCVPGRFQQAKIARPQRCSLGPLAQPRLIAARPGRRSADVTSLAFPPSPKSCPVVHVGLGIHWESLRGHGR